ncbi:MAG: hypothetical protein ACT4O0_01195 [Pseudonocardia sp.]
MPGDAVVTGPPKMWSAGGHTADELDDLLSGVRPRTCRNMRHIGTEPVDAEQRAAWRELLAREGKLAPGARSIGELVGRADRG